LIFIIVFNKVEIRNGDDEVYIQTSLYCMGALIAPNAQSIRLSSNLAP